MVTNTNVYLPPNYSKIEEYQIICETNDKVFDGIKEAINNIINDNFTDTLTEAGCERKESMLGITKLQSDTIEDRRFRINARMDDNPPYTLDYLKNRLTSLCDGISPAIVIDYDNLTISVKIPLGVKKYRDEAEKVVEKILPANLSIEVAVQYNTHIVLHQYTHAQLHAYTHNQLREEVFS